jgi:hypothetical protein
VSRRRFDPYPSRPLHLLVGDVPHVPAGQGLAVGPNHQVLGATRIARATSARDWRSSIQKRCLAVGQVDEYHQPLWGTFAESTSLQVAHGT